MRIVPARNGWAWLIRGFALFRKSPAMWLLLVLGYWIAMTLLGQVPYLGLVVSTLLLPAFSVSFMSMCAVLDRGGTLRPALLLSGFRGPRSTLTLLGALYLVSIAGVFAVGSIADGGAFLRYVVSGDELPSDAVRDGSVSRALLLSTVAATPVVMAFWFAPVLVAWNRMGAVQALFYSFFAAWRNWRAFLVYGAVLGALGVAFLMFLAAVLIATHGQAAPVRVLAPTFVLLTLPTVFASFYASYRDVFPENRVPEAPA